MLRKYVLYWMKSNHHFVELLFKAILSIIKYTNMIDRIPTIMTNLRVQETICFGYEHNIYPCKTGRFAI